MSLLLRHSLRHRLTIKDQKENENKIIPLGKLTEENSGWLSQYIQCILSKKHDMSCHVGKLTEEKSG
jgi:hypothetical protein